MKPGGRCPRVFIPFSLMMAVVALAVACTGLATPTPPPTPSPTAIATPAPPYLEERLTALLEEAREIRDVLTSATYGDIAASELNSVQSAIDDAIVGLRLTSLDARSTCDDFSSTGGCGLTGGTVPANFLYPNYLRFGIAGDGRSYSWDATGLISLEPLRLDPDSTLDYQAIDHLADALYTQINQIRMASNRGLSFRNAWGVAVPDEQESGFIQAAVDAAIADLSLSAVDARYNCNDFSSSGGCGLTGGTVPANFLYPSYLRFGIAGDGRSYSWDRTGLVRLGEFDLDERGNIQAAIDAAIALRGWTSVDARSGCTDFSSRGGCGLTGGGNPADFLYPYYLRFRYAVNGSYSWNTTGRVSTP